MDEGCDTLKTSVPSDGYSFAWHVLLSVWTPAISFRGFFSGALRNKNAFRTRRWLELRSTLCHLPPKNDILIHYELQSYRTAMNALKALNSCNNCARVRK